MRPFLFSVFASLVLLSVTAGRAEDGSSVVVVYNQNVKASKQVADYYAEKRGVPANQILGLSLPEGENMSRQEFTTKMWRPLWDKMESGKFFVVKSASVQGTNANDIRTYWKVADSTIRYMVLCYGVPLRVQHDPSLHEPQEESLIPQLRNNGAAVENELCLLPLYDLNLPVVGLVNNPNYGQTNTALLSPTNGLLMVTRLDGPTPEIAMGLVDKALAGEAKGLWGRAYIDSRNIHSGAYLLGDEWMRATAVWTKAAGFETVLDEDPAVFPTWYPMSHIAFYAGWYTGTAAGPFSRAKVEFMPGAFAYHLNSFSAATVRNPTQNWVAPLLAAGAACTMGSVDEPYLMGTPDIGTFARLFLLRGQSFGEAAYACNQTLSWKTAVIGDPLYRPMARDLRKTHEQFEATHDPLLEWSHMGVINRNENLGTPPATLATYIEEIANHEDSSVLMEKLGDLDKKLGKPASALASWQKALPRSESLQQTIRLKLTIADALAEADQPAEALDMLDGFLRSYPDYSNRKGILEKAVPLAEKTGRKEAEAGYRSELLKLQPADAKKSADQAANQEEKKPFFKIRTTRSPGSVRTPGIKQ
jgi:uncharacterized protein (TIGR03790 family)